jgi:hypothetical protein
VEGDEQDWWGSGKRDKGEVFLEKEREDEGLSNPWLDRKMFEEVWVWGGGNSEYDGGGNGVEFLIDLSYFFITLRSGEEFPVLTASTFSSLEKLLISIFESDEVSTGSNSLLLLIKSGWRKLASIFFFEFLFL